MKIDLDLLHEQTRLSERTKLWLEHRHHYIPVIEDPMMACVDFTWTGNQLYAGASGDSKQLSVLFSCLASNGFRLPKNASRPELHKPDWGGGFVKTVSDPTEGLPDITLRILVSFTSTVCRFEQVGTEMKEVPVYKIRCGEALLEPSVNGPDDIPF